MTKFKIGDIVTSKTPIGTKLIKDQNLQGKIIFLNGILADVEFTIDIRGHSCGDKGKNHHCWNIETTYLILVNPSNMEPIYDIY